MYLSSKSTTLTAARWPTRTRRKVMSVAEAMSHTAMERSLEQVTISPLLKRKCRTASLWWINVFRTSPVFTSQTLDENRKHNAYLRRQRESAWHRHSGPILVAGWEVWTQLVFGEWDLTPKYKLKGAISLFAEKCFKRRRPSLALLRCRFM